MQEMQDMNQTVTDQPEPEPSPVPQQPAPTVRRRLGKRTLAILVASAVLLVACVTSGAVYVASNRPEAVVRSSISGFFEDLQDQPLFSVFGDALQGGQIRVQADAGNAMYAAPFTADLFLNSPEKSAALQFSQQGQDALLTFSPEQVGISGSFLNGKGYRLGLRNLKDRFRNSIFYPTSGSKYALPLNDRELAQFEDALDEFENQDGVVEEASGLIEKYETLLFKELLDACESSARTEDGCRIAELTLNGASLAKVVRAIYDAARNDDDLIDFLNRNLSSLESTGSGASLSQFSDPTTEAGRDFRQLLADVAPDVEDLCDDLTQSDLSVVLRVTASRFRHTLRTLELTIDLSGDRVRFTLDCTEPDTAVITLAPDDESATITISRKDDVIDFSLRFVSAGRVENLLSAHMEIQSNDNYALTLTSDDEPYPLYLRGKFVEENDHILFSVTEAESNGRIVNPGITVEAYAEATMPSLPSNTVDLLDLREDAFDDLLRTLGADPN